MTRTRAARDLAELADIIAEEAKAYGEIGYPAPVLTVVNSDAAPVYSLIITSRRQG